MDSEDQDQHDFPPVDFESQIAVCGEWLEQIPIPGTDGFQVSEEGVVQILNYRTGSYSFDIKFGGEYFGRDIVRWNDDSLLALSKNKMPLVPKVDVIDFRKRLISTPPRVWDYHFVLPDEANLLPIAPYFDRSKVVFGESTGDFKLASLSSDQSSDLRFVEVELHVIPYPMARLKSICPLLPVQNWLCMGSEVCLWIWDIEKQSRLGDTPYCNVGDFILHNESFGVDSVFVAVDDRSSVQVRSMRTLELLMEFEHGESVPTAMHFCPMRDCLFLTGCEDGCVCLWDRRKIETPVREEQIHHSRIWKIESLADGNWASGCDGGHVAIWDSNLKRSGFHTYSGPVKGICFLGSPDIRLSRVDEIDERMSVLEKTGCMNGILQNREEATLRTSIPLLSSFSKDDFVEGDPINILSLASWTLTPETLLLAMFGEPPAPGNLWQLYVLFRDLKLLPLCFAICSEVATLKDVTVVAGLVNQIRREFGYDPDPAFTAADLLNGNLPEIETPNLSTLDPFVASVLKRVLELKSEILANPVLHRCLPARVTSLLHARLFLRPIQEHPAFAELDDLPSCVAAAFRAACKSLWSTRKCSNAIICTSDGGKENCHVEILVMRSNFFFQMLKFNGKEFGQLKESGHIELENFSHEEMRGLLEWIYTWDLREGLSLRTLFMLLTQAEMFGEIRLFESVKRRISEEVTKLSEIAYLRTLFEIIDLVTGVPEELQDWLIRVKPSFKVTRDMFATISEAVRVQIAAPGEADPSESES